MMPAAKHFDPVLGVDVHIILIPPFAIPTPIPHPFVGIVMDVMDYVQVTIPLPIPFVGVVPFPLGASVKINGMYRAIAGTMGKAVPPHIPLGGPFAKPPPHECEMFMGSSTVEMDGDAASHTMHPTLDCWCIGMPPIPRLNPKKKGTMKSMVLPSGMVLPIPAGPPVLIGGPPTISLMAMGMKLGFSALGKGLGRLAKSGVTRRAGDVFKKVRQKLFKKMKPGKLKCKILRAEPVDVITGEVVVDQQDFVIPGRIPMALDRHYGSHTQRVGVCGHGWETPADARLVFEDDASVAFYDGGPGATIFPSLPDEGPVTELVDGALLDQSDREFTVRTKAGLIYSFPRFIEDGQERLVTRVADLYGNYLAYHRNNAGLTEIEESAGRRIEVISENGRVMEMRLWHPDHADSHPLVRYDYDFAGNLVAVSDALDRPYRFAYDGHRLIRHTDRNGLSFYYEYNDECPDPKCIHAWGDGGLYNYHFEYVSFLGETHVTDSLDHITKLILDERGLPVREIDALGGETLYEYDDVGRTTAVTDPLGNRTQYDFDASGNLLRITRPDGAELNTDYNAMHRPITDTDAAGNVWQYEWNERGEIALRRSPRGGEWSCTCSERGDVVAVTDALGATTRFRSDRFGDAVAIEDALGNLTRYDSDAYGNTISRTDPLGQTMRFRYDDKSRLLESRNASSSSIKYEYDGEDNLTSVCDENGHVTSYRYTGLGEIAEKINPDGSRLRFEYDTEERLTALINERGERYTLERDALGRVSRQVDYWGSAWKYTHDVAGNVIETVDPLRRSTTLEYDQLGRLVRRGLSDGEVELFAYDSNGNMTGLENGVSSITRQFDEEGNVVEEVHGDVTVTSRFNFNGNRTARSSSHGHELRVEYDRVGNVSMLTLDGRELANSHYDALGRVSHEKLVGHLRRDFSWDTDGRLAGQRLSRGQRPIVTRQYRYDSAGNLIARMDGRKGRTTYEYDALGRVQRHTDPENRIGELTYDLAGNSLSSVGRGGSTGGPTGDRVRIFRRSDTTYTFDLAGNLIRRESRRGVATFDWDSNNRLHTSTNERGQHIAFGYDPLGRRAFKEVDGLRTRFAWDGDTLLSDEKEGEHPREFIFRPDSWEPLASVNGRVCLYETDAAGLPHEVIGEVGELLWSARFGPFGEVTDVGESEEDNPLRFLGQYHDEETGLSYNRHRYFDPTMGSFVSQDPIGLAGGTDLYSYGPNVWRWVDPLGLTCTAKSADIKWKGFSRGSEAQHFAKHGTEFGDITQAQYKRMAKEFAGEVGEFQEQAVGNFIVKFHPSTRRTLIGYAKARQIRTFYKADFRDADPFTAAVDFARKFGGG